MGSVVVVRIGRSTLAEPGGGQIRSYDTLFTAFGPALKAVGLGDQDIRQLLVTNPRKALTRS